MASNDHADDGTGVAPGPDVGNLDEWVDHQRLRSIFQARQEAADELQEASKFSEFYEGARRRLLLVRGFRGVQRYLHELEPLLIIKEDGQYKPKEMATSYWRHDYIGSWSQPGPYDAIEFNGLKDVLGQPAQRTRVWTETVQDPINGEVEEERRQTVAVPIRISINAFRTANRFFNDVGIEFDPERDGIPEWGFEEVERDV